jgi:pimeloyl-ACP methyl ester carboxylesterase
LHIPDAEITDLRERLARTRFPDEPPLEPWSTGTSLAYLKPLIDYWQNGFDWRVWEGKLNGFPQFTLPIRGIDVHFIYARSRKPNAMPLLLSHGWPGSVFEFHKIIPLLTEHFTVVAPSLPGYTLSFKPGQPRFGIVEVAEMFAELMSALGYTRFGAQGGDWGSFITSVLGHRFPQRMTGIHLNLLPVRRDPAMLPNPNAEEKVYLDQLKNFLKEETGYQWIQGTRPQTLAFGLTDSAAGLAAWIVEKFHAWTDKPRRNAGEHFALLVHRRDRLVVLAVSCAHARAVADPGRRTDRGADGLCGISPGDPEPAAFAGGEDVYRHPPLDHHEEGRPFRRTGETRRTGA